MGSVLAASGEDAGTLLLAGIVQLVVLWREFLTCDRDVLLGSPDELAKVDANLNATSRSSAEDFYETAHTMVVVVLLIECPEAIDCKHNGADRR